jgi:AmiR/NasT family two-component response regulator
VTGVIGFRESLPPIEHVPDALVENLWSAYEIARLRGELKTVSERLASRKLVEQAKSTLQAAQSISEERAYEYLRSVSRKRRITLAALSAEILGERGLRSTAELTGRMPESAG